MSSARSCDIPPSNDFPLLKYVYFYEVYAYACFSGHQTFLLNNYEVDLAPGEYPYEALLLKSIVSVRVNVLRQVSEDHLFEPMAVQL